MYLQDWATNSSADHRSRRPVTTTHGDCCPGAARATPSTTAGDATRTGGRIGSRLRIARLGSARTRSAARMDRSMWWPMTATTTWSTLRRGRSATALSRKGRCGSSSRATWTSASSTSSSSTATRRSTGGVRTCTSRAAAASRYSTWATSSSTACTFMTTSKPDRQQSAARRRTLATAAARTVTASPSLDPTTFGSTTTSCHTAPTGW